MIQTSRGRVPSPRQGFGKGKQVLVVEYWLLDTSTGPGPHTFHSAMILLSLLLAAAESASVIRVNQVGYLPDAPKVAILCSLSDSTRRAVSFVVRDSAGRVVAGPTKAAATGGFGACAGTWRLDFSKVRRPGTYELGVGDVRSPRVRIGANVFAGAADTLLMYMRQQRSGF